MTFVEGGRRLASTVSTVGEGEGEDDVFWDDPRTSATVSKAINKTTTVEYYAFFSRAQVRSNFYSGAPQKVP
jgi:hypothetical protein